MAGVDLQRLHKKARQAVEENLADDEVVLLFVQLNTKKAALIGTDRRAFIFKTGVASGATFGQKFGSFDYRTINGVQLHHGLMTGSIVLDVAGAAPVGSSYWGSGNNDPWKAQNAIPIGRPSDAVKSEVAKLRELIANAHAGPSTSAPAQPTSLRAS